MAFKKQMISCLLDCLRPCGPGGYVAWRQSYSPNSALHFYISSSQYHFAHFFLNAFPQSIVPFKKKNIATPYHPNRLNFGERCLNAYILEGSQTYTRCWCISFSLRGKINAANSTNNKKFGGNSTKLAAFFPSERPYSVADLATWMQVVNPTHFLRSKPQFRLSPKAFKCLASGK